MNNFMKNIIKVYFKNTFINFLILAVFEIIFLQESFANQKNLNLTFNEINSEGKKTGCSLEFLTLGQDYVYKKGTPSVFIGSFSNMILKDKFSFLFKIGIFDKSKALKSIEKDEISLLQSDKINYVYFRLNNCNKLKDGSQSEINACYSSIKKELTSFFGEKGEFISIYNFDINFFTALSNSDLIEIGFNREKNGIDQKLKIILDERDHHEILEFTKCSLEILEENFLNKKR
jgi:hypothetical protein